MSLYRTYRPLSFADVVGQDAVVTTLENAAAQGKLSHAFLFAGGRGTGKTSVARILAKILMTKDIEDDVIQKQIIKGVEEGSIVDLLEIDAASNRGIDDVRDLIEKIQFSPVVASAKVYIIDEAHMLTKEAFNALLKTLEEPPAYAYFILATTEINKIPVTIQSRCQRFPFRSISEDDIVRRLQYIADQEKITVERDALRTMARHVEGGMRDAITMLDQMRSLPKITKTDVEERIGSTGDEHVEAVLQAIVEENPEKVVQIVRKVEEAGLALDVFLRKLLTVVRTTLHKAIEEKQPIAEVQHILEVLLRAIRDVRIAPVPGLVVESALLSLCLKNEGASTQKKTEFVLPAKQEEKTEEKKDEKKNEEKPIRDESKSTQSEEPSDAAEQKEQPTQKEEKPKTDATVEAQEVTMENVRTAWPEIVAKATPPSVKMSLKNGDVVAVDEQKVTVSFSSAFHKSKVANLEASRTIEDAMKKIFHRNLRLECVVGEGESTDSDAEQPKDDSVNLAEAAAEIF